MSAGAEDLVAIPRPELDELVGRLGAAEQEIAELRDQVAAAQQEAEETLHGFLFEMRFDQAVRERKVSEVERPAWRAAFRENPDAVDDALGVAWRWAA